MKVQILCEGSKQLLTLFTEIIPADQAGIYGSVKDDL
jgi:hypothetical protein